MTVGVIYAGGEMSSVIPQNSAVAEITNAGYFDPAYARCALSPQSGGVYFTSAPFVNGTTNNVITSQATPLWFAMRLTIFTPPGEAPFFSIFNSSGQEVFRLTAGPGGLGVMIRSYYWNGSAFVQVGSGCSVPAGGPSAIALMISTTAFQLFVGGTLNDSASATMTAVTNIGYFRGLNPGNNIGFSELLVADVSLVTYRCFTIPITGQGSNAAWTGPYTNIDGIITNDGSFVYSPTAAQVTTYVNASTIPGNIRSIVVSARANCGSAGPQNLQLTVRSGGTNYSSSDRALGNGYTGNLGIWDTDPNTGVAWTSAGAEAMEYGATSAT